jgi:lipid II:glycine glycyltransferase (peptidoglycan interpeptide bridge formation enzyme)
MEFLQSENWLKFQEATGKRVVRFSEGEFLANGIVHKLPIAGTYLYVPRGPLTGIRNYELGIKNGMRGLLEKAKEERAGWIRIEPETEEILADIKKTISEKIVKAPHDMQSREVLVVDIMRSEEELLAAMKPKTRYNIRLAEKRGVKVFATRERKYQTVFLNLIQQTAGRKEITPHPRAYYEKMLDTLPEKMWQLFVAEYENEIIAANLLIIFETTATYLHGGSSDKHRDVMAPYLLQWEQMKFAKTQGCARYDFGGIRTQTTNYKLQTTNAWAGITRFKMGFSPQTATTIFPGTYDLILNSRAYFLYKRLHYLKKSLDYVKKFIGK